MKKVTMTQRKWLLIAHILFVGIWFGGTVIFLVLSIAAVTTNDENVLTSAYTIMHLLATTSGRASIIGTVITGILLSVLTNWGLFKYYWIMVKEALTILSMGLGFIAIYFLTLKAFTIASTEGMASIQNEVFITNTYQLFTGIILQILSLLIMIVVSVFKPWGKRTAKG